MIAPFVKKKPRYEVHSECVRGERRSYWVWDSHTDDCIGNWTNKRSADRACANLNKEEDECPD